MLCHRSRLVTSASQLVTSASQLGTSASQLVSRTSSGRFVIALNSLGGGQGSSESEKKLNMWTHDDELAENF